MQTTASATDSLSTVDSMKVLRMDPRIERGTDGLPRVNVSNLRLGQLLGQGGDRGSVVFVATMKSSTESPLQSPMKSNLNFDGDMTPSRTASNGDLLLLLPDGGNNATFAYKQYSLGSQMTADEHLFSTAAYQVLLEGPEGKRHVRHLVVPEAVVRDANQRDIGILMPIFSCSLHSALRDRSGMCASASELAGAAEAQVALRTRQAFTPVTSRKVVSAITYQILLGLSALHSLAAPKGSSNLSGVDAGGASVPFQGFSHNDLNLRNVLLHKQSGRVAICDFELAHRLPTGAVALRRIPPVVYIPPFGLLSKDTDVWCLGLLVVELVTGVQPLLNATVTEDDFAEGPLRLPFDKAWDGVSVIDWEANIRSHVQKMLALKNSDGCCSSSDVLLAFCGRCLSNCEGAVRPSCSELLRDPLFADVNYDECVAEQVVMEWAGEDAHD